MFLGPQWHFWSFVGRLLLPCHRSVDDHRWARGTSWDESRPEKKKKKKLIDSACKFLFITFSFQFNFIVHIDYAIILFPISFFNFVSFCQAALPSQSMDLSFIRLPCLAFLPFPSLPFPSLPFPSLSLVIFIRPTPALHYSISNIAPFRWWQQADHWWHGYRELQTAAGW